MKTISEIEKVVKHKRRQYFDGYNDLLKEMSKYSEEELDYVEVTEKAGIESYKRLSKFKNIFSLVISVFALVVASIPETVKNNVIFFELTGGIILAIGALVLLLYLWLENFTSQNIDVKVYVLELVKKVRERK